MVNQKAKHIFDEQMCFLRWREVRDLVRRSVRWSRVSALRRAN